ncbi:MAG: hypothetical protein SF187_28985 [Deltaproteobacteria bacterium]|nr:hypothetical protein [Deltaproteobacteria bacterium]
MASDKFYREAARRTHRTLGSYLVQWAWMNGVDCVVIGRADYMRFVGLQVAPRSRMPSSRIEWLKDDLASVFPYAKPMWQKGRKWSRIFLSRQELPASVFKGIESVDRRLRQLADVGVTGAAVVLPTEKVVVEAMARVASGIEDFQEAPWAK